MKFKELKPLKEKELNEKLNELKRELLKDKTEAAKGSQVKNRSKIGQTKKAIARILTLLHQRTSENKKEGTKNE